MRLYTTHNSVESAADTIKLIEKETDLKFIGFKITKRGKNLWDLFIIEEKDEAHIKALRPKNNQNPLNRKLR